LNLPGLCPVCGGAASRKVVCEDAGARETYRCPVDGDIEYVHGAVPGIRVSGNPIAAAGFGVEHHEGFMPLAAVVGA
jgi:hypothetical protein